MMDVRDHGPSDAVIESFCFFVSSRALVTLRLFLRELLPASCRPPVRNFCRNVWNVREAHTRTFHLRGDTDGHRRDSHLNPSGPLTSLDFRRNCCQADLLY
jgi:hypothetical protein